MLTISMSARGASSSANQKTRRARLAVDENAGQL